VDDDVAVVAVRTSPAPVAAATVASADPESVPARADVPA